MDQEREIREVLLKEYAEASNITRHHEQLARTSLAIFLPAFVVAAGFLLASAASPSAKLVVSCGGVVIALLLLNTVLRLQTYYRSYIARAKQIESLVLVAGAPVMNLYTQGENAPSGSGTISNKTAIGLVLALAVLFFTVSAVRFAYALFCGIGL